MIIVPRWVTIGGTELGLWAGQRLLEACTGNGAGLLLLDSGHESAFNRTLTGRNQAVASRKDGEKKVVTRNRRAKHDYAIKDTYEAGLVLQGTEVKSLREGRATITEGFVQVKANEAWLFQTHPGIRVRQHQ